MASTQAYGHVQNRGHGPLPSLAWAYYWDAVQGQDWDAVALAISVMRGVRPRAWTCIGLEGKDWDAVLLGNEGGNVDEGRSKERNWKPEPTVAADVSTSPVSPCGAPVSLPVLR